ncbi:MAG: carboxypeptidase-like regulatory domain-containing protein, partial [Candidatus Freyarchaeota archaeon]
WFNLHLNASDYIVEKYAFYIWDASGGDLSEFTSFADGVSALERQTAPLTVSVGDEEYIHYTVNVHVTDYDRNALAGAIITINSSTPISKTTNDTGYAVFYLEPGTYNFSAVWNGTTEYESYKNHTVQLVDAQPTNVSLVFNNITTLICRTQFSDYNPIQNAYVRLNKTTGEFVDQSDVNLTGYAVFHINRSSWFGNYVIEAFWQNGTQLPASESYTNEPIDRLASLNFTVTLTGQKYTYITYNATTSFNSPWGSNIILKIYWRDSDGNNLNTSDSGVGGSLNWTLNFINGTNVAGPTPLSPQGSDPDVYYILTIPSSLLLGGETYQVYINAEAGVSTYLSAANQTIVYIVPATLSVQLAPLVGPYYWKHSDIPLWVNVTDSNTGDPITTAEVNFTIVGTSVSGQLSHSSPPGNYTYTIPASVVEASLSATTYSLRFTITNTNYTSYETSTQLVITTLQISAIYRDSVDNTTISTGTISYSVDEEGVYGGLGYNSITGNWTGSVDSTLFYPGYYILTLTAHSTNYQSKTKSVLLQINNIPTDLSSQNFEGIWGDNITIWAVYNRTHPTTTSIEGASLNWSIQDTPITGTMTDAGDGNYTAQINATALGLNAGSYILVISASKQNYTSQMISVTLTITSTNTSLTTPSQLTGMWGGTITIWAVYNRTHPTTTPITDG